ncbi:unnamed protein product [Absidia cylindrospora]
MSAHTVQCPICSQEFPLYDQRGFRNAGFTAHHNWCIGRQQQQQGEQQNNGHHSDQQSTRASRFTMAIRRKLLPVSQAPILTNEGQSRISSIPDFQESSPGYVSSSQVECFAPPVDRSTSAPQSQSPLLHHHVFEQQQQQQQQQNQPILRQRHTWNHWNIRRTIPRRTSANTMITPSEIVSSVSGPTPLLSQNSRASSPPRALDPDTNMSLFRPSTSNASSATTWIDLQTALPLLSSIPATSSPTTINDMPFSSAPTNPTLPLESSRNTINSSSSSFIGSIGAQLSQCFSAEQYTSNDLSSGYLSVDRNTDIRQQQYSRHTYQQQDDVHRYDGRMSPFTTNNDVLLHCTDSFFQQSQESNDAVEYATNTSASSLSPSSNSTFSPTDLCNYQPIVIYCGYCDPRDGLHDSSCALLQFFLANIMDDSEDPFPST